MVKNDEVFRFAQAILCRHPKGHVRMNARHRLILALLMSSVMVCMAKLLITFLDLGLRSDFLLQWAKAYFIAWPVAATTAFFIMPSARHHAVGATPHASHCWADRRPALMSCAFSSAAPCWPRMPSERVRFRDRARRGDSCRAQCRPSPR